MPEKLATPSLQAELRQFILKQFPLARKQGIGNSDALLENGMLDSLGVLEVVRFIEEAFSIAISDDDLVADNFQTIDRMAAFISRKTATKA